MVDLDDLFAYQVPKISVIRDRRLGLMRYFFLSLSLAYVVVYEIVYKNGGYDFLEPSGQVVLSSQAPTLKTEANLTSPKFGQACCGTKRSL